jgi:hypothetical protein
MGARVPQGTSLAIRSDPLRSRTPGRRPRLTPPRELPPRPRSPRLRPFGQADPGEGRRGAPRAHPVRRHRSVARGRAFDAAVAGVPTRDFLMAIGWVLAAATATGLCQWWMRSLLVGASRRFEQQARDALFRRLLALGPGWFARRKTGRPAFAPRQRPRSGTHGRRARDHVPRGHGPSGRRDRGHDVRALASPRGLDVASRSSSCFSDSRHH